MRKLTDFEMEILSLIGTPNSEELDTYLRTAKVEDVAKQDRSHVHLRFVSPKIKPVENGYTILLDWHSNDLDGAPIELLAIGNDDGFPVELEIRRLDMNLIKQIPPAANWKRLTV